MCTTHLHERKQNKTKKLRNFKSTFHIEKMKQYGTSVHIHMNNNLKKLINMKILGLISKRKN